jgi:WD40 repeat protein
LRVWHASGLALSATSAPNVVALGAAIGAFVTLNVAPTGVTAQRWSDAGRPLAPPLVLHPNQNVDAAFLSGDGRWAGLIVNPAPQPAPVSIWSVAGRQRIATVPRSIAPQGGEPVFSPDRQLVAMGKVFSPSAAQESFVLVDANSGRNRPLATTSCSRGWRGYVFNSTSTLVAAGSFCGEVHVWNTATGKPVGHPVSLGGELADIAFSPDSKRIAIASWNSTIKVADVADGRVIATLTNDTRGDPQVIYSPNGRYLATASLDHTVRIWDAQSLTLLRVLTHPDPVEGLAFTPDSRNVLTFDGDSVVREWDACTDCENSQALLALARTRVTRSLTAEERRTFGLG